MQSTFCFNDNMHGSLVEQKKSVHPIRRRLQVQILMMKQPSMGAKGAKLLKLVFGWSGIGMLYSLSPVNHSNISLL